MAGGDEHRVTPDELERLLEAHPRFRKAPPGNPDEVTVTFVGGDSHRAEPAGGESAEMLPLLRATRAGEDGRILQLTLHIARPAALHVGSVDGWGEGGPHVIVRGTATHAVTVTDELLAWFAGTTAERGPLCGMVLRRHPDSPGTAAVHVEWRGFLDGLTEAQLALACRAVGEGAKSCCMQLVNGFGAGVPTDH